MFWLTLARFATMRFVAALDLLLKQGREGWSDRRRILIVFYSAEIV